MIPAIPPTARRRRRTVADMRNIGATLAVTVLATLLVASPADAAPNRVEVADIDRRCSGQWTVYSVTVENPSSASRMVRARFVRSGAVYAWSSRIPSGDSSVTHVSVGRDERAKLVLRSGGETFLRLGLQSSC